jgi:outer membrane receptor protein involved in Fe transport
MLPPLLLALAPLQDRVSESVVVAPRSHATVTSTRAEVTVVTAEELAETGERSLPRALERAAGGSLWLQETNLGGGAPVLRGLVGSHILIVVDGVRVNDSTTRLGPNQSLNNFDTAEIERVEIVRGPASVLWGSDAIGGAILIWTKRAGVTGPDGPALAARSGIAARWDTAIDGGTLAPDASLSGRRWGLFATGSWFSFDDIRTGAGDEPPTGYHGRSYFGSFEHELGRGRALRFTASAHRDLDVPRTDRLIVGFGQTEPSDDEFLFSLQDRRRFLVALTDANDYGFADRTEVRTSYRTYTETRDRIGNGSSTLRRERDEVATLGLGVDFEKALGPDHLLTYGLDVEQDEVDSTRNDVDLGTLVVTPKNGAFAPDAEYRRAGVFAQDETSFGAYDATLGARYSYYDFGFDPFGGGAREEGDFDALTLSAQVGRQVTDDLRLTATVAQGYRAPNLDDLANNAGFAGGTELGNADLQPERSLTYDLGAEWSSGAWGATAAVFRTEIDDLLGRVLVDAGDPLVTGDETYLRENVGRLVIYGVEAALRHPLDLFTLGGGGDPQLFGAYSLTWTKGTQYDDLLDPVDGKSDARRIPPLFGRVALEVRPREPVAGTDWLDLELRWAARQDDLHPEDVADPRIDPNGTPGWAVVNVDLGGTVGPALTWSAGVHNLFDAAYRVHASGFDGPGIAAVVGLEWRP